MQMHSHWRSRRKQVIVLRGKAYTDRQTQFLMILETRAQVYESNTEDDKEEDDIGTVVAHEGEMICYQVPPPMQVCITNTETVFNFLVETAATAEENNFWLASSGKQQGNPSLCITK